MEAEARYPQRRGLRFDYEGLIFASEPMRRALESVDQVIDDEIPVLLEGESGTGKEIVARAIHSQGPRRRGPFVVVNCAAIPEELIESELFGHARGAFTGAIGERVGKLAASTGGSLFLDEVGEMPLRMQAKLLRALQFGEVTPLGSDRVVRISIRVISATHRDLRRMVAEGHFREDLYYRLAVFPIRLPALRDRPRDIGPIAESLVKRYSAAAGRGPTRISERAIRMLMGHQWPGNVRELENVIRRSGLRSQSNTLDIKDLLLDDQPAEPAPPALRAIAHAVPGGLRPREERVVALVLKRGRVTIGEWEFGSGASRATAARDLARLIEVGVLTRRGRGRGAYCELSDILKRLHRDVS